MSSVDELLSRILKNTRSIALVGASPNPARPSYQVMEYLQQQGYRVIPVNPEQTGNTILGETCLAQLTDISEPVDMVDVFRRSEFTPEIASEAVAIGAKYLWLQLGVINEQAASIARSAGLDVVMNCCPKIEYPRLLISRSS